MSPSSFEKAIRLQFDCLIRKVIDRTIKNYYRELGRRAKHEVPFCDVTEADLNHVAMENSNNSSTVNNYYQQDKQEPATASTNASQPVNVTVPVTVSTPEAKGSNTATPEAPETTSIADKNINIVAKGVDVKLEITGDSYNISISAPEGQESQIQPVNEVSTVNTPESTTEPQRSPNWIEYITVILLAVLVGLEIKDKLHKEK